MIEALPSFCPRVVTSWKLRHSIATLLYLGASSSGVVTVVDVGDMYVPVQNFQNLAGPTRNLVVHGYLSKEVQPRGTS